MAEALDARLREVIVCPRCRGRLTLEAESLDCAACRLAYPIRSGIPVLLTEQATPLT